MNKDTEEVYTLMKNKFLETHERHVSIVIPSRLKDQKKALCEKLESEGKIANTKYYGQDQVACDLVDDKMAIVKITY